MSDAEKMSGESESRSGALFSKKYHVRKYCSIRYVDLRVRYRLKNISSDNEERDPIGSG